MTQQSQPDNSEIVHHEGGTTLVGADATRLMQAIHVKAGIRMWAKNQMKLTRGASVSMLLRLAHEQKYTSKKHPNNAAGWTAAMDEIDVWINTMKAALPVTDKRENTDV